MSEKDKLTSVKIPDHLFDEFKIECVRSKFSLQKLVERSIFLFLTDSNYRTIIYNTTNTAFTGSL